MRLPVDFGQKKEPAPYPFGLPPPAAKPRRFREACEERPRATTGRGRVVAVMVSLSPENFAGRGERPRAAAMAGFTAWP
jgi:hypothetical protein